MSRYFAKKCKCIHGHTHASKREAARCVELHVLQQAGEIGDLEVEPQFWFVINGEPLKHQNGRRAGYKPDFGYTEAGSDVVEDVKASNGFMDRDVPLRTALFRALFPTIELRVVK